ncbi:hypothetical protein ACSBR2_027563 [Camellia fascicularis]
MLVKALSTNLQYLKNKPSEFDSVVDYKDWQVGTGCQFKSLRLWLVLRSYGIANLQSHIRSDVRMTKMFEEFIKSDSRFEILMPWLFSLEAPGVGQLSGHMLRSVVGATLTEERHIFAAWKLTKEGADALYSRKAIFNCVKCEDWKICCECVIHTRSTYICRRI